MNLLIRKLNIFKKVINSGNMLLTWLQIKQKREIYKKYKKYKKKNKNQY